LQHSSKNERYSTDVLIYNIRKQCISDSVQN